MKNLINKYKWLSIVLGILLIIGGVVLVVISIIDQGLVNGVISVSTAVVLFLMGGMILISGIIGHYNTLFDLDMLTGSFLITIGVILCIKRDMLPELAVSVFSIILLAYGGALVLKSITLLARRYKNTSQTVFALILGILAIVGGVLFLCFKNDVLQVVYISTGVLITFLGILYIVYCFRKKN